MSTDVAQNNQLEPVIQPIEIPKELVDVGLFYGRTKSKTNPKMRSYIIGNRNGVEIINVLKTLEGLEVASAFLKAKVQAGGVVLFVGTQPAAQDIVQTLALKLGMPYVVRRWPGGSLTNFKVISKRVEYFKKLKSDLASGALDKYTKKERGVMQHEIGRLSELMGGLEIMTRLPDALVVIDPKLHETAMREARRMKIPVVAFANVDADPDEIDYLVIGNNNARKSILWFLGKIEAAIEEGSAARAALPKVESIEPKPAI